MNIDAFIKFAPLILNEALSVSPVPDTKVYVKVSPLSTSDVENVPIVVPVAVFSACDELLNDNPNGVSFTLLTLIVKIFVNI